jgi:hypothetical protein
MQGKIDPRLINLDAPLRLAVAASLAYPDGSMSASGLRREAAKGRLVIERTAGKDYTTLRAIEEMRERCRVNASGHACGSGRNGETSKEGSFPKARGSSSTEEGTSPRDVLRAKLKMQKSD